MKKNELNQFDFNECYKKITEYRESYFDVLIRKYGNLDEPDEVIDIRTLKVVKIEGKRKSYPGFGKLNTYNCEPAQNLINEVIKLSGQSYPVSPVKLSKYDDKNKTTDVSAIHPIENRTVDSRLKSNKQEKYDNLSQELDKSVGSKQKRYVEFKTIAPTVNNSNANTLKCEGKGTAVSNSFIYKNIPVDDFLLSSRRSSKNHKDNIKTTESKSDINYSLDSKVLHDELDIANELRVKGKANFEGKNWYRNHEFSYKPRKQKSKNDAHKCKKLDTADRQDYSVDSVPSFEAANVAEKSFNASDECSVQNNFKNCTILLEKLDITQYVAAGKKRVTEESTFLVNAVPSAKGVNEAEKSFSPVTDSNISSKEYNDNNKAMKSKNKCYVLSKHMSSEDKLFTSNRNPLKGNSKNDTRKYKKLDVADRENFSVDDMPSSKKI